MNKLILVGNGFDLAHGLPTSYTDFLNHFWKTLYLNIKNNSVKYIIDVNESYLGFLNHNGVTVNSFDELIINLDNYCKEYGYHFDKDQVIAKTKYNSTPIFKFKNIFFKKINQKKSLQNWVDIENEYYFELKKIAKLQFNHLDETENNKVKKERVVELNQEFNQIKELLLNYLDEEVIKKYSLTEYESKEEYLKMSSLFKHNSKINNNPYNLDEFSFEEDREVIKELNTSEKISSEIESEVYILNFNYTDYTFSYHIDIDDLHLPNTINSIHGDIGSEEFKPIFGFGDEMDEDYKFIENIDDNEYLRFFKSFEYFQNSCYDSLIRFISSKKFQVLVLGHSCGLSDRVMLNTIFESENCSSIKIFYHKKKDGTDNYSDIVKNISRHFKNKPLMRRKIVNKEYSSPLPQTVRFKKIKT